MKRAFVLLVVVAGCQQPPAVPVAEAPSAGPQPVPQTGEEIEFSDWPTATDRPVNVFPQVARMCAAPSSAREIWAQGGGPKRHGPHFKHWIVVRVNPGALEAFKAGDSPVPVGTVVVKEKHTKPRAEEPAAEYGAMIKREPGYDPQNGDWEYLYVVRRPEKQVARGRLSSCVECHAHASEW
jgi:hypothetical protein